MAEKNEKIEDELDNLEGQEDLEEQESIDIEMDMDSVEENPINILEAQLAEKERLSRDYMDKLQRTMAEYDNFRKRTVKEKATMYENGAREVMEKMLPVIDNFQRALNSTKEEEKDTTLALGIELIYKQLMSTIKDLGVEEIDAVGKEFDPNLHHAVAHEENEAYGSNEVIEVLQSGYIYKERVLRCSMVRVAN